VVVLDTRSGAIPDEPKLPAELRVHDAPVGGLETLTAAAATLSSPMAIEVRGYTSQEFPKKQYGLELRDERGEDVALGLLGLPAEEDWVLHAPFMDKSLMRNVLAYELSRRMGRYAPRTRFVELFLLDDGASAPELQHYAGLYVLTEPVERGPERVDIEKLEAADDVAPALEGGYLLEWTQRKRVKPDEVWLSSRHAEALVVHDPKSEDVTTEQLAWVTAYIEGFEAALAGLHGDPDSDAYESFIDVEAAVDYCLLSELLRNHDVFVASTFVHKPRSGRLVLGPAWDFDRALGDVEFDGNWREEGWLLTTRGWARELLHSNRFRQRYVERWRMHRAEALHTDRLSELILDTQRQISGAAGRNFERWRVLGRYVKANRAPYSNSFEQEVGKLARWLSQRAAWIDEHIEDL
jgi:CotH protein